MKQSMRWVKHIKPERQKGRLMPHIANITVNLFVMTCCSNEIPRLTFMQSLKLMFLGSIRYYKQRSPVIYDVQEYKATSKPSEVLVVFPLKGLTEKSIWVKQYHF